ncbi:SufE family protein [Pelagibius sp. Alg239-R121]|uniref:SufE family protein n=1 Tax=Pelagibius sp. Alg239-R121 TaxID=2993448 RepID=UPI0024A6D85F|nr:SufE family protein [Pelagibius sp. Alg239-R121]
MGSEPMQVISVDELVENFEFLDDWEDRYRYIIDLGRKLPEFDEADKNEQNRIQGCTSQAWLIAEVSADPKPVLSFRADSDAHIVRGLLSVLLSIYSGQTAEDILAVDIKDVLRRLDFEAQISPNRANGFYSAVERIRNLARLNAGARTEAG